MTGSIPQHGPVSRQGLAAFCDGKEKLTAELARKIIKGRGPRSKSRDKRRSSYKCPFCQHWHIGNPPPKAVRSPRGAPE
jgi:hypothetical protein